MLCENKKVFYRLQGGDLQADDTLLLLICGEWTLKDLFENILYNLEGDTCF